MKYIILTFKIWSSIFFFIVSRADGTSSYGRLNVNWVTQPTKRLGPTRQSMNPDQKLFRSNASYKNRLKEKDTPRNKFTESRTAKSHQVFSQLTHWSCDGNLNHRRVLTNWINYRALVPYVNFDSLLDCKKVKSSSIFYM